MSLEQKLATAKSEKAEKELAEKIDKINEEIAELDKKELTLLSRSQKISDLLDSLLASYLKSKEDLADFKDKKAEIDNLFAEYQDVLSAQGIRDRDGLVTSSEYEDDTEIVDYKNSGTKGVLGQDINKIVDIKEELKRELPELDLKFSGGKKGAKSNRELSALKIIAYLESLKDEIDDLEEKKMAKYLETPEGQEKFQRENENRVNCRREVSNFLPTLNDVEKINQIRISPHHLELAGVYGVELVQETILSELKKKAAELLLHNNFAASKNIIKNFQRHQEFIENLPDYREKFNNLSGVMAELKTIEDQTVLTLADIVASNRETKQGFIDYGLRGETLDPKTKKMLFLYDDVSGDNIYDSPAALSYEYVHHLLYVSLGRSSVISNYLKDFEKLATFSPGDDNLSGSDVFGKKYQAQDFSFLNRGDYDPEFLLQVGTQLKELLLIVQDEIKAQGKNISPQQFLADFGKKHYNLMNNLATLSDPKAKITDFPREYINPNGTGTKDFFADEADFNKFKIRENQVDDKLRLIIPARWLEEELKERQKKNPEIWHSLGSKIELDNYLKFLEQNKEYHLGQLIEVAIDDKGKIQLLDSANREAQKNKQLEFEKLEDAYKEYLKTEINLIITEISQVEKKWFNKESQLTALNNRLGTCQTLSSYGLLEKMNNTIPKSQAFKEESLTAAELSEIKRISDLGRDNLREQKSLQLNYQTAEKELNRYPHASDFSFLLEYSDLVDNISTYDNLISNLKLVDTTISSLLKEKYSGLMRDFIAKLGEFQKLVGDYNRKYGREDNYHLDSVISFKENLEDYL